jgi:hypothetical protein
MVRLKWLALAAVVGVVACSDKSADTPTAPDLKPTPPPPSCSFPTIGQLVNAVFTGQTDNNVGALVNDAKNLKSTNPAAADLKLYEVLDSLAYFYGQGSIDDAAKLAYQALLCTTGGASGLTENTFEPAFGTTGAFASIAYEANDKRVVGSHDGLWVLHPIGTKSWNEIASTTPLIIYGAPIEIEEGSYTNDPPIESTTIFDWKSHPAGVTFSPPNQPPNQLVVGNCEPGEGPEALYLQHNSVTANPNNSGPAEILDFVAPNCTSDFPTSLQLGFAQRIWQLVAPTTLHASFFFPTSGGKKGALSPDAAVSVDALEFDFVSQPVKSGNQVGKTLKGKDGKPLAVTASSDGGTSFKQTQVFGFLQAKNNQGEFVQICNNWDYSDENGKFEFVNAFLNKAGGYTVQFLSPGTDESTSAPNTPEVDPIVLPITDLFNVKNGTVGNPAHCQGVNAYTGTGAFPAPPGPPPVP